MHGKAISDIRIATGMSEASIRRNRTHVLGAICLDALYLQSHVRFGGLPTQTTLLEVDETLFKSKSLLDDDGQMVHYLRPYIAVLERQPWQNHNFACTFQLSVKSMSVTKCVGEKKLPPLDKALLDQCLTDICVGDDANLVLMTDGGENPMSAYHVCLRENPGIVQHETVCHGQKQYTRACVVRDKKLPDGSWTYRECLAGEQKVEGCWRKMEAMMPFNLKFSNPVAIELWIRYAQWRYMISSEDPWTHYCRAIREYPRRLREQVCGSELEKQVLDHIRSADNRVRAGCPHGAHREDVTALRSLSRSMDRLREACDIICGLQL